MALHWSWSFSIGGSAQNYLDSGWQTPGNLAVNFNYTAAPLPLHPSSGVGGMTHAVSLGQFGNFVTAPFPRGDLADGIVQFRLFYDNTVTPDVDDRLLRLYAADETTILFELRPTANASPTTLTAYSGQGAGLLLSRGVTVGTISKNQWHTLAVRFKPAGVNGYISISIDRAVEHLVVNAAVGATSNWACIAAYQDLAGGGRHQTGYVVFDDPMDDALENEYWTASLKPTADAAIGTFTTEAGGVVNLFTSASKLTIGTVTNCWSVAASELRFTVTPADVGAGWNPSIIAGVNVIASVRASYGLRSTNVVIDDGVSSDTGTVLTNLDSETSVVSSDVFALQADGVTAWDLPALSAHSFGYEAA